MADSENSRTLSASSIETSPDLRVQQTSPFERRIYRFAPLKACTAKN
jgi:hypothetical protein